LSGNKPGKERVVLAWCGGCETLEGRTFRYVYDARNQLVGVYRRQANGDVGAIFDKFIGLRRDPGGF